MRIFKLFLVNIFAFVCFWFFVEVLFYLNDKYFIIKHRKTPSLLNLSETNCGHKIKNQFIGQLERIDPPEDLKFYLPPAAKNSSDKRGEAIYSCLEKKNFYCAQMRYQYRVGNNLLFQVKYSFENEHIRINNLTNANAKNFILAGGCSFTFGQGVEDNENYPSQLAKLLGPDWSIYNWGRLGASSNTFYDFTLENRFTNMIHEKSGIFIWLFIPHHLDRVLCPLSCQRKLEYWKWLSEYEYSHHALTYIGRFGDISSFGRAILRLLSHSKILEFFNVDFPDPTSELNYQLYFELLKQGLKNIEKTNKVFLKKYFVTFQIKDCQQLETLQKMSGELGLEFLDFSEFVENEKFANQMMHPYDFHPTKEAYWYLSQALSRKIKEDKIR